MSDDPWVFCGAARLPVARADAFEPPACLPRVANVGDAVRRALADPVVAPRLRTLARGAATVAVAIPDASRPCPSPAILEHLLEELHEAGVPDDGLVELLEKTLENRRAGQGREASGMVTATVAAPRASVRRRGAATGTARARATEWSRSAAAVRRAGGSKASARGTGSRAAPQNTQGPSLTPAVPRSPACSGAARPPPSTTGRA